LHPQPRWNMVSWFDLWNEKDGLRIHETNQ
jgi:hypothetical protein